MLPLLAVLALRPAPEPRLKVEGDIAKGRAYTAAELRAAFGSETKPIAFTEKGVAGRAHTFPLAALLRTTQPRLDPKRKHVDFSLAVVAVGPDGYSAVFSGAELSTELGKGEVWVALDWNDKPLAGDDAPVRLIVPGDAKPSRWVHGVRTLRIVDLAPKGHGPAPGTAAQFLFGRTSWAR